MVATEVTLSDDSSISEQSPKIRFQTPTNRADSTPKEKKSDKPIGIDVKKLFANAFKSRIMPEKNVPKSAGVNTSGSGKALNPVGRTLSTDVKDKFKKPGILSSKIKNKRLRRQGSIVGDIFNKKQTSGPLARVKPLAGSSATPKAKRFKRLNKEDKVQMEAAFDAAINTEKEPYTEYEIIKDEFLDPEFDLENAINKTKIKDSRLKFLHAEWSGQDVINALEPKKVEDVLHSLNRIKVYRTGPFRPLFKTKQYLEEFVKSSFFENFMTL